MKTIAGAILILAAAVYGVAGVFFLHLFRFATNGWELLPLICGLFWLVHLIVGFLLIIASDEPPPENLEGRLSFDTKLTIPDEPAHAKKIIE